MNYTKTLVFLFCSYLSYSQNQVETSTVLLKPIGHLGQHYTIDNSFKSVKYYQLYLNSEKLKFDTISFYHFNFNYSKLSQVERELKFTSDNLTKLYYYNDKGLLESEFRKVKGKKELIRKYTYNDRKLINEIAFKDGKLNYKIFHLYNKTELKLTQKAINELNELDICYIHLLDENGRNKSLLKYKDGTVLETLWKYNKNGTVKTSTDNTNIKEVHYNEKGQTTTIINNYSKFSKSSSTFRYNKKGDVIYYDTHNLNTKLFNKIEFEYKYDDKGNIVEAIEYKNNEILRKHIYNIEYK